MATVSWAVTLEGEVCRWVNASMSKLPGGQETIKVCVVKKKDRIVWRSRRISEISGGNFESRGQTRVIDTAAPVPTTISPRSRQHLTSLLATFQAPIPPCCWCEHTELRVAHIAAEAEVRGGVNCDAAHL